MSFNTDALLNKRSPLAPVWLASHVERKVSKAVLLKLSIPNSVDAIAGSTEDGPQVEIMALRLSGQLLLGVARIYSRKAKYLMDDCSEALVKIKMAFRSAAFSIAGNGSGGGRGNIDMDQEDAPRANINLAFEPGRGGDFDMLFNADFGGIGLWNDMNALLTPKAVSKRPPGTSRTTVSRHADITLQDSNINLLDDYEDGFRASPFHGDDTGIGSQDFRLGSVSINGGCDELDLGLDLDLDMELDLGLDLDNNLDVDKLEVDQPDIELGSSPIAANKQRMHTTAGGPSRVASIAAAARERSSSEAPSVEIGRDAAPLRSVRDSIASDLLPDAALAREDSVFGLQGDASMFTDNEGPAFQPNDFEFGGNDFDLDMGIKTPGATSPAEAISMDKEPANPPPSAEVNIDVDLTPRTANRVADFAAMESATRKRKERTNGEARSKPAKVRKQIVDSVTEMQQPDRRGDRAGGDSFLRSPSSQTQTFPGGLSLASREERMQLGLLKDVRFIPQSAIQFRFEEISKNPAGHFFAGMAGYSDYSNNKENVEFYAGPPGLPKDLRRLFSFSIGKKRTLVGQKRELAGRKKESTRQKLQSEMNGLEPDSEIELGRDRQSSLPSVAVGEMDMLDFGGPSGGDDSNNFMGNEFDDLGGGVDRDINLDVGNTPRIVLDRSPSRFGTPDFRALDESLNIDLGKIDRTNASILNVFDVVSERNGRYHTSTPIRVKSGTLSVPGTKTTDGQEDDADEMHMSNNTSKGKSDHEQTGGWSRNTVKALKILEHELQMKGGKHELSFDAMSNKASRKAAASMFFEVLILGTRDCIKLTQAKPYENITITGKKTLWEVCEKLNNLNVQNADGASKS